MSILLSIFAALLFGSFVQGLDTELTNRHCPAIKKNLACNCLIMMFGLVMAYILAFAWGIL